MKEEQFNEVIRLIKNARLSAFQSINKTLINLYWLIGQYISHRISATAWGEKTISELAKYIKSNHSDLKGYDRRNLYRMKQFYETYSTSKLIQDTKSLSNRHSDSIVSSLMTQSKQSGIRDTILTQLSWTHHLILMSRTRSEEERYYYMRLSIQEKYSLRQLERQINLLFYHRGLQCLVAFELKADKFKPGHLGQLNFYLEALDRDVKKENENPSIGILLCKERFGSG